MDKFDQFLALKGKAVILVAHDGQEIAGHVADVKTESESMFVTTCFGTLTINFAAVRAIVADLFKRRPRRVHLL